MWYRRLLASAICLISGLVWMGKAEAQIKWFGFSNLCFEGTFKGGSVKDGELSITLSGVNVRAACLNTRTDESCQPGEGNAGDITIEVPASADPTKEKGIISAEGCISLDQWDDESSPDHQHICLPYTNENKIELKGSAYIPRIDTKWELTNNGRVIAYGNQTCFWNGTVDSDTCFPAHDSNFTCPIDEMFKK